MPETTDETGTHRKIAIAFGLFLLVPIGVIAAIMWH
jgi:hypothetical protein